MSKTANKIFLNVRTSTWMRALTVVVMLGFGWQCYHLARRVDFGELLARLGSPSVWPWFVLVLAMMPLNWWLEARKWQLLLRPFLAWPFAKTLRATMVGVSLSAATPNRIGEIGGRMLMGSREEAGSILTSSLLGSAAQWVAFLLLAWPALMWTAGDLLADRIPFPVALLWPLGPGVLLLLWFGGKPLLVKIIRWVSRRFSWNNAPLLEGIREVKFGLMMRAGAYACLRFCVYCMQLHILLGCFGLELPLLEGMAGIAAIYLVQAGIPLPPGLNLVTRTELGLLLWNTEPGAGIATVLAFGSLFAINVLLPALPAYWLLVRKKNLR
ncbi:lysylphosphatidylglycerol synthase domain-containing protein [Lewinella sp. W8]|uniref:lysylphosphatidylglycerol synthase domain-containing protein n=1 Tax=Lewinella sp. W8 TaxID=2528208 RepID=UPI00106806F4|nr:lysylphosphatidylglycerol synthase domain-containing protein [Lewinella sp. W8]MTB51949.1 hypothetical protein [Lewinella sp. W8]